MLQYIITQSQRLYRIGLLLAAFIFMMGAGVYYHKTAPEHFAVVADGILYRSALLRPNNLNMVIDHYGIKTIVDLSAGQDPKREPLHQGEAPAKGLEGRAVAHRGRRSPDDDLVGVATVEEDRVREAQLEAADRSLDLEADRCLTLEFDSF